MRLFNFQIPDDLYNQLVYTAAENDKTASLYVREAIREKLAREVSREAAIAESPKAAAVSESRNEDAGQSLYEKARLIRDQRLASRT